MFLYNIPEIYQPYTVSNILNTQNFTGNNGVVWKVWENVKMSIDNFLQDLQLMGYWNFIISQTNQRKSTAKVQ